jgi:hypothetical protein
MPTQPLQGNLSLVEGGRVKQQEPTAYTRRTGKRWRAQRLHRLGYASYADYLASEHWRLTRAAFWTHPDTPRRCLCGNPNQAELQLHHKTYLRIGAEDLRDLQPLCGACHRDVHLAADRGLAPYDLEDYANAERKVRYAQERAAMLRREGDEITESGTPFNADDWREAAKQRHVATEDRRAFARRLAKQTRRRA